MPPCLVDPDRSSSFANALKPLHKRFPHILEDLEEIWPKIAADYTQAAGAECIPGGKGLWFKYQSKSTDLRKGARNAFRVIGYYHELTNTLYPVFIYYKGDLSTIGPKAIGELVKTFLASLEG